MRTLPEGMAARIASGAATLCHAWIVTLKDGGRQGFTDHDQALEVEGVVCRADGGWTAGAAHQELGHEPGMSSAGAVLDVDGLTETDIRAGRWDGARVEQWRVDWSEPALRVRLSAGSVRKASWTGERVTLEIEGPMAALAKVVGRTYGRSCDAVLGDGRCGVAPEEAVGRSCDKRFETCRAVFDNARNFRGFPDMPGDDFLIAGPGQGVHDGGSRR